MKRLLLLLAFLLVLTGCESELRELEQAPVSDTVSPDTDPDALSRKPGYVYTHVDDPAVPNPHTSPWNYLIQADGGYVYAVCDSLLFRFNPETGYMTTLCPDPLCGHMDKYGFCPMNSDDPIFVARNGRCYFHNRISVEYTDEITGKRKSRDQRQSVIYDPRTASFHSLCEECVEIRTNRFFGEDTCFFFRYINPDDPENSNYGLYKIDLTANTHKHILVKEYEYGQSPGIIYATEDYLYYIIRFDIHKMSIADPTNDTVILSRGLTTYYCDEEHFYFYYSPQGYEAIQRFDMNGENLETVVNVRLPSHYDYCVTDQYVYYRTEGTRQYSTFPKPLSVGSFWRVPKDGGEPEPVFTPDEEFLSKYAITQFRAHGNYIYAVYYDVQTQYTSYQSDEYGSMMRIDVTTGEYDIINSDLIRQN